jgi:hypothetical protein
VPLTVAAIPDLEAPCRNLVPMTDCAKLGLIKKKAGTKFARLKEVKRVEVVVV